MRKTKLMNSEISHTISLMGHTDKLVIADAGLPIPKGEKRIDLAVRRQLPTFISTLKATLAELKVERMVVANETKKNNPEVLKAIEKAAKKINVKLEFVSHEAFKKEMIGSAAIVRTGECTPYANVILYSGVTF